MISLLLFGLLWFQDSEFTIDERLRVEFVLLDIEVLGQGEKPVIDLKQSDFEVKENGKKVEVTFFETLDFRASGEALPVDMIEAAAPVQPIQQFIIALDLESTMPPDAQRAFHQISKMIAELDPRLNYRINIYSLERGSLTKGFVDEKAAAEAAIRDLQDRHNARFTREGKAESRGRLLGDHDSQSTLSASLVRQGEGGVLVGEVNSLIELETAFDHCNRTFVDVDARERCIRDTLAQFITEQEFRTRRVIGELEALAYNFQEAEGLKTMLFVSPGFTLSSLDAASDLAKAYLPGNTGIDNPGNFIPRSSLRFGDEFQRVVHACVKNRAVFHTFDIFNGDIESKRQHGGQFGQTPRSDIMSLYTRYTRQIAEGLVDLAEKSGGRFYQLADLGARMGETMERGQFFYVLGYNSPNGKPGKFRRVQVKIKRKGLDLYYRKGYFGAE